MERERKADYRTGLLAAAALNPHLGKGKAPLKPEDFFPYLKDDDDDEDEEREADMAGIKALFASLAPRVAPTKGDGDPTPA